MAKGIVPKILANVLIAYKVGEPNLVIGVSHMGIHYSIWTCNWRECHLNFITRHDIMDEQLGIYWLFRWYSTITILA